MLAALGVSTLPGSEGAGRDAAERLAERLAGGPPQLTLLLVAAAHGRGLPAAVEAARAVIGGPVVGASVEGVVAPGVEVSDYPAVLALGLRGGDTQAFFVHDAAGEEGHVGEEIVARIGTPGRDDLVCLLVDSQSVDVAALARSLPDSLGGATLIGTGAAPPPRGRPLLWGDGQQGSSAISGFVVRGVRTRIVVAGAGRPVTPLLPVTRARGHWVTGLAGRPALDVYEQAVRDCGLHLAPGSGPGSQAPLLAGLVRPGAEGGELLLRNVVGIDPERRAFSLPGLVTAGQALALVRLDPESARDDMEARFRAAAAPPAAFGLYLNCRARGASLFGEAGVEATHLANAFADCPIAGVSSSFQLAPLGRGEDSSVLTYAGALALVGDRSGS